MASENKPAAQAPVRRKKFTEGLLDSGPILQALEIRPGQVVVDAGCGTGYMAKLFAGKVSDSGKVYAFDHDAHFLELLADETKASNIEPLRQDITKPSLLKKASVDLVYISALIYMFSREQVEAFVREVKRVLKPGGRLAIVEMEKKETPFGPPLNLRYSPEDLQKAISLPPVATVALSEYFYMQIFRKP